MATRKTRVKRAVSSAADPRDNREYPALVVQDFDGYGEVQFFPTEKRNSMSVGFTFARFGEAERFMFDGAVKHHAEFCATTANDVPEFVVGKRYLRNYFGVLFGPLGSDPEDDEACFAEALERFGVGDKFTLADERQQV